MEYYLVRLSYTPAAWQELIEKTTSLDQRLEPVRRLIRHLGGSLASFHFFDPPHYTDDRLSHAVRDKFALLGEHDLLTVLAIPDRIAAGAFNMAISAEPGLKAIEMLAMMPLEEAITAMARAKSAIAATGYAAPGRAPAP